MDPLLPREPLAQDSGLLTKAWLKILNRIRRGAMAGEDAVTLSAFQQQGGQESTTAAEARAVQAILPPIEVLKPVDDLSIFGQTAGKFDDTELKMLLAMVAGSPGAGKDPAAVLYGTHAARVGYPASSYDKWFYFETDRKILYLSVVGVWEYAAGTGTDTFENRWADLTATDVGVPWLETSRSTIASSISPWPRYRWDGTNWILTAGAFLRTNAQLAALTATMTVQDVGAEVWISDRGYAHYEWNGTAWVLLGVSGQWAVDVVRAMPAAGNYIDIGNLAYVGASPYGAGRVDVSISWDNGSTVGIVKRYIIAGPWSGTLNAYWKATPVAESSYGGEDFDLIVRINKADYKVYFYLQKTVGVTAGNADIHLVFHSDPTLNVWTGTSATAAALATTGTLNSLDLTEKFLVQTADVRVPNAQAMAALATGIVKNTTTTGVQSIAVGADLPLMTGDAGSGGAAGAVPAPGAGDAAAGKFLKADASFAVPPGTGTANSVLIGIADATLDLTDSFQDISQCAVSLDQVGTWLIFGIINFTIVTADDWGTGQLLIETSTPGVFGAAETGEIKTTRTGAGEVFGTWAQVWKVVLTAQPRVAKLQAKSLNGLGASKAYSVHSRIAAMFVG